VNNYLIFLKGNAAPVDIAAGSIEFTDKTLNLYFIAGGSPLVAQFMIDEVQGWMQKPGI
jgi:hypothetical protein